MMQMELLSEQQQQDQQVIDRLTHEIKKIGEEIDKKTFSLEYVIRELYLSGYYKNLTHPGLKSDYLDLKKEQIATG